MMMSNDVPFPLVDLLNLEHDIPESELRSIGDQIVEGFKQTGYVYLKNHGLTLDDIESFVGATSNFFDLEEDIKIKYKRNIAVAIHGYSTQEYEAFDSTISQSRRATRNNFDVLGSAEKYPDHEVPQLRKSVKPILGDIKYTVTRILRSLELGLKIKDGILVNGHKLLTTKGNSSNLKSIRYMPPERNEQAIRFEPHYDITTVTLQLYSDLEGLQILNKDGGWQKPKMFPGNILLFPGESIQMWTGDEIKASLHRVVIPEDKALSLQPRHAVIFFVQADADTIIEPLDGSDKYEPITSGDFFKKRLIDDYFKADYEN